MAKRFGLVLMVLATVAVAAAYASAFLPGGAPAWAAWAMAIGIPGTMVAMMIVGAARQGRVGRLWLPFAFVFVVVAGGFCVVLALPPVNPADPTLWLGLPPRAAVILYGIGLLPLIAMPIGYALTFDEQTLSEGDLERVRRMREEGGGRREEGREGQSLRPGVVPPPSPLLPPPSARGTG